MAMQPKVIAPGEVAPLRHLYTLTRGGIMFGGRVLACGAVWGDDVILSNPVHFLPCTARAIHYSDVLFFSRATLLEVIANYPRSVIALRKATVKLALRRAVVAIAKGMQGDFLTPQKAASRLRYVDKGRVRVGGDFMDRVDAATGSLVTHSQKESMELAQALEANASSSSKLAQPTTTNDPLPFQLQQHSAPLPPLVLPSGQHRACEGGSSSRLGVASTADVMRAILDLKEDVRRLHAKHDALAVRVQATAGAG